MKYFEKKLNIPQFQSNIIDQYLGDFKYAVFDIETTGLSPKWCKVILVGLASYNNGHLIAKQILAQNRGEEKELLESLAEELKNYDYVVTYNGKMFDMPFIATRYNHYGIIYNEPAYDLDLYHILRYYSDLKSSLPNMRQKTIEKYMGLSQNRTDEISGADSVVLYEEYEATQDPKLECVINLHNFDDIVRLYELQPVLLKSDLHRAFFGAGFPIKSKSFGTLEIKKMRFQGGYLTITGKQHNGDGIDFTKFQDFESDIKIQMNGSTEDFQISVPIHREPAGIYVNLSDFIQDCESFQSLNGYVQGSLILMDKTKTQYEETNLFAKKLLEKL